MGGKNCLQSPNRTSKFLSVQMFHSWNTAAGNQSCLKVTAGGVQESKIDSIERKPRCITDTINAIKCFKKIKPRLVELWVLGLWDEAHCSFTLGISINGRWNRCCIACVCIQQTLWHELKNVLNRRWALIRVRGRSSCFLPSTSCH